MSAALAFILHDKPSAISCQPSACEEAEVRGRNERAPQPAAYG